MILNIDDENLPTFLACLTLGVLKAIESGAASPDLAVATVARPKAWAVPEGPTGHLKEVLEIMQTSDELSGLAELDRDAMLRAARDLSERLEALLKSTPNPSFDMAWRKNGSIR